ncbi:ankyrin repeat-containing protein BDA1-like [Arachis stenosperma]|uniref:ankyrin repeat-containing protein BDA1-like n=1 Tax=Arachis stenosperma TaxID=217475 RepID=UPI0025AC95CF|nr:ankyrin repeat-containing protein BDA1-like [Arachis stenosperma]
MAKKADKLEEAAMSGDLNKLYEAIKEDAHILEKVDAIPFVETPLHIAAAAGHVHFAIQIMRLKPSFALKLNQEGLSPVHVALHNNHHNLVRRLVQINGNLIRVKEGREGLTPLHLVCQFDDDDEENFTTLLEFLDTCPDSIGDVNVRNETALQVALRRENITAFQVLLGWLIRNFKKGAENLERSVMNQVDEDGNTILHISTLMGNTQAVILLVRCPYMSLNYKNSMKQTALDLAESSEIKRILCEAGTKPGASIESLNYKEEASKMASLDPRSRSNFLIRLKSNMSGERRDAYLVVMVLVITAIYQTALSPPGGLYQADADSSAAATTTTSLSLNSTVVAFLKPRKRGESVLPAFEFILIQILNSLTLLWTIIQGFVLVPGGYMALQLSVSLTLFVASYIISILSISPTFAMKVFALICFLALPTVCALVIVVKVFVFKANYELQFHRKLRDRWTLLRIFEFYAIDLMT